MSACVCLCVVYQCLCSKIVSLLRVLSMKVKARCHDLFISIQIPFPLLSGLIYIVTLPLVQIIGIDYPISGGNNHRIIICDYFVFKTFG